MSWRNRGEDKLGSIRLNQGKLEENIIEKKKNDSLINKLFNVINTLIKKVDTLTVEVKNIKVSDRREVIVNYDNIIKPEEKQKIKSPTFIPTVDIEDKKLSAFKPIIRKRVINVSKSINKFKELNNENN